MDWLRGLISKMPGVGPEPFKRLLQLFAAVFTARAIPETISGKAEMALSKHHH